jgi:hypothetical protein
MRVDAHLIARDAVSMPFGRRFWLIDPPDFVSRSVVSDE